MIDRLLAPPASRHCLDLNALTVSAEQPHTLSGALADAEREAGQRLARQCSAGTDIVELVQARAWVVEQLVLTAWQALMSDVHHVELVAVGGLGRGEMHPHSDVDLLVLAPEPEDKGPDPAVHLLDESTQRALEHFIRTLWDAGLSLGHSVRSVSECVELARADIAEATNLMESRLLAGHSGLFHALNQATSPSAIWPAEQFFSAKLDEQRQRHDRFEDTVYNLEPDIKSGPGGLRDIQVISWVARRHFGTSTLHGLVEHGFMTQREHQQLVDAEKHLWSIRWALHQLADRAEERLLFDHQRALARHFGFNQDDQNAAVEQFMQGYYRTAMQVERLNEQLLQIFEEELLLRRRHLPSAEIDEDFRVQHGYLELVDDHRFVRKPELLLKIFLVLSDHPEVRGVRASTIRLIRDHLYLIDDEFRSNREYLDLFLQLLKRKHRVYSQLERMNRYGVLAALVPGFAQVTGRMQFDLFHVYTVDQHILFVIRNLRRIARKKYPDQFAHPNRVVDRIGKPEVLYLAALFHDIAKGRGGDHSELGAEDARAMVDRLSLEPADRDLIVWLVEQHLLMSMTAQRQDISDPVVVDCFARHVGSQQRLDHLYVLTAADIAATRPKLWNGWKDSLLWQLYIATRDRLAEGLNEPIDHDDLFEQRCSEALNHLSQWAAADQALDEQSCQSLWNSLPRAALTRMDADQLAWSTRGILRFAEQQQPGHPHLAQTRNLNEKEITELLVYGPDFLGLFAIVAHELDRMQLDVLAARIATTREQHAWNMYQIVNDQSLPLHPTDADRLQHAVMEQLASKDVRPLTHCPIPRRLRPFITRSTLRFEQVEVDQGSKTRLDIMTTDRPGLLSMIAAVLLESRMRLYDARVATFGQRVEDVFLIGTESGRALNSSEAEQLEQRLRQQLDAGLEQQSGAG